MTIRTHEPADDLQALPLFLLNWGEPWSVEQFKERRTRWAHRDSVELVAEEGGRIVGWCNSVASGNKPTTHWVRGGVAPDARNRGVATAMLQEIERRMPHVDKFGIEVRDNDPEARRWVEHRGFEVKNHQFESELDLPAFQPEAWQSHVDRLRASGLTITTMAELGDDESARYRFWEIEHLTDHDIPGVDVEYLLTWEDGQKIIFGASHYDPAGEFLALDGDRFVGLSGVGELSPGRFYNQHTCTLRDYRGQGIASGLKILALEYAKSKGGRICRTNNHSQNAPMLAINQRLGYVPQPGWFDATRTRPKKD